MRVAINLLTEDPRNPSGTYWFWTRMVPEMARHLGPNEELHLLVSPQSMFAHAECGPSVHHIRYPWSNERRVLRTLSEHIYSPLRLPRNRIDVLSSLMAPVVNRPWSLVVHMKTMHAYSQPESVSRLSRAYRRFNYPHTVNVADAIIVNSLSVRSEIHRYLRVDNRKLHLIYEAVDHDLFTPGHRGLARQHVKPFGLSEPFVLFVSSLWQYKNCDGLLRAWALARPQLAGRQLAVVGAPRDARYAANLRGLASALGIAQDVVFVGAVPLEDTVQFYRAADAFVYPSFNETFGLPILESMASGCPVVTSDLSSMPEVAGDAAILVDPHEPASIASGILAACNHAGGQLRDRGLRRAAQFTWRATAEATLDVYREVHARRRERLMR